MRTVTGRKRDAWKALLISSPLPIVLLFNGFYLASLSKHPLLFFATDVATFLLLPCAVLFGLTRHCGVQLADIGLLPIGRDTIRSELENAIAVVFVWLVALMVIRLIAGIALSRLDWLHDSPFAFSYRDLLPQVPLHRYLAIMYFAASAAFAEELYYRGILRFVLFEIMPSTRASLWFLVLSGLLFGGAHWESGLVNMTMATVMGIVAARLVLWSGSLWPSLVAHFLADLHIV